FYPYVWIFRMFGRSIRFARTKKSPEKALEADERSFIESVPGFFVLTGFFGGILFAAVIWLSDQTGLSAFLDDINLTSIIEMLGHFFGFILEVILWIIGIDKRGPDGYDRFGLLDIIFDIFYEGILLNIVGFVAQDAIMTFIGIGVVGVIIAIVWIIISETGIVGGIISVIAKTINFIITVPTTFWDRANTIYLKFNHILSSIVIGRERLNERNIGFHRKILLLTLGLGIYTFIAGIVVGVSNPQDLISPIGYIFVVILVLGIGVGIIEMFLIVRILDIVSRKKYVPGKSGQE
ncbi:MAG: hypothetical protein ACXABU_17240, partial [Candidatus Hodarchaeales archaeon]